MIRLFGYWQSVAALRVRIALNLKGLPFEETPVDLDADEQLSPAFLAINPQGALPALVVDDGPALTQSLAILEYLEETYPEPPLLPGDAVGRARVRSLALLFAADNHPVLTPRVVRHLTETFRAEPGQRRAWVRHWFREGLRHGEACLAADPATGTFCHGDTPGLADLCLVSHAVVARGFRVDTGDFPTVTRIAGACLAIDAFARAMPRLQPGAPPSA